MRLGVIGLGRLGLPMAALYAYKGYDVIGLDQNKELIDKIQRGECPIYETQLEQYMACMDSHLKVTTSYDDLAEADLIFIIVPTPSKKDNKFDNKYVLQAIEKLGDIIREKEYCVIVITSTVMPGTMENEVKPLLEKVSGKICGQDFGLCYNPEFIVLGNVIDGINNPDAVLIGESDKYAGDLLEKFYESMCDNSPPIARMSWWNAELAKLSLNVYITTKISIANTITEVCSNMPTGDVDAVTSFLGMDSRIGSKYLKGGLGFGGPCFPRDNRAFIAFAKGLNVNTDIQKATHEFNTKHNDIVVKEIAKILNVKLKPDCFRDHVISVLGLTYKPNTNVVEESASCSLINALNDYGAKVEVYDPQITKPINVDSCLKASDLCVLATTWAEFKFFDYSKIKGRKLLDCWRWLDRESIEKMGVEYYALGVNV